MNSRSSKCVNDLPLKYYFEKVGFVTVGLTFSIEKLGWLIPSRPTESPLPFSPNDPPTSTDLRENLYAVHATYFMPRDTIIRPITRDVSPIGLRSAHEPASFRPGLHFSLGGLVASHGDHSWEDAPYAVVASLGTLEPGLANIYAHDTFTVGNFALDGAGVTLFIPAEEDTSHLPDTIDVRRYSTNTTIRSAIDKHITDHGGWRVRMNPGDVNLGSPAYVESRQINDTAFFSALLTERPDISFGVHTLSIVGDGFRYGAIDQCINKAVESYRNGGHNPISVELNTELALYNLDFLEAKIHASSLSRDAQEVFDAKAREVRSWGNVIRADLALAQYGKTIAYTDSHIQDAIWSLRRDPDSLSAFIERHWSQLRQARPSEELESYITASKMACLPLEEVNQFFADRPELGNYIQGPMFNVLYAVARLSIFGDSIHAEGLESLLMVNIQLIDEAGRDTTQGLSADVEEILSPYLNRNSTLVSNALNVVNQPAIRQLLDIENANEPIHSFDDLLDRHPKTAEYKTGDRVLSEKNQTLFNIMVGLHWVRASETTGNTVPANSFSEAAYRKSNEHYRVTNFKYNEAALTSPIRDGEPTGYDNVPINKSLSAMQVLCRGCNQDASKLWKNFDLAVEYRNLFASDDLFWSSDRTVYDIYQELVVAKAGR